MKTIKLHYNMNNLTGFYLAWESPTIVVSEEAEPDHYNQ